MPRAMDQANTLRQIVSLQKGDQAAEPAPRRKGMRVIAITSGKGGVGKTSIVVNLCIALSKMQRRVLLLDADMGLANVDVLLGITPRYTLEHVLSGQKRMDEIMMEGPGGMKVLPASSGISELSELSYDQQMQLFQDLSQIEGEVDYLFIDTGAGISSNVLRFNASANEVLVVASPEPTSITDAYALMKLLAIKYHLREFNLIANSVLSEEEGQAVFDRLNRVAGQFLSVRLNFMGSIPMDKSVTKAVRMQQPFVESFPASPASRALLRLAVLLEHPIVPSTPGAAPGAWSAAAPGSSFWDRLLHWKKVK